MQPILFMPEDMAKAFLKSNRDKKILIISDTPLPQDWITRVFYKPKHDSATFSLFTFPINDPERIANALTGGLSTAWAGPLQTFVRDIIQIAEIAANGERISFGAALDRAGFDLSYDSFVRCAFDANGNHVAFRDMCIRLNIHSPEQAQRTYAQEGYQYIAMQISELYQIHQERLAAPSLIHLEPTLLLEYDAVLMVGENKLSKQDANMLFNMALDAWNVKKHVSKNGGLTAGLTMQSKLSQ